MSLIRHCVPVFLSFVTAIMVLLQAMSLAHEVEHLDADHKEHSTECVECMSRMQLSDDDHLLPLQLTAPIDDYHETLIVYKEDAVIAMARRHLRLRGPPLF